MKQISIPLEPEVASTFLKAKPQDRKKAEQGPARKSPGAHHLGLAGRRYETFAADIYGYSGVCGSLAKGPG